MCNDPNKDTLPLNEIPRTDPNEIFERFYYRFKQRLFRGENPDTASLDAPDGFTDWLKSKHRLIK